MKIVVIGATSSIAEHCCRLWVTAAPVELVLIARDAPKVEKIAADLRVRSPTSTVTTIQGDLLDRTFIQSVVDGAVATGPVDIALIAHGWMPDNQVGLDLATCEQILDVNAVSPVLFAEAFAAHFVKAGRGTIAVIGSVAGDVTRKTNYLYGASKALLTRYAQGLDHRLIGSGVKVVLIKPGPTDTAMTAQLKAQGRRMAPVEDVARATVDGIRRGKPVVYTPLVWQLIMLIVRHIPRPIFNRLPL
jgi:decaprenylphospho-beta-D-erythro-pentofuranosid-2-ulose 2-reductase